MSCLAFRPVLVLMLSLVFFAAGSSVAQSSGVITFTFNVIDGRDDPYLNLYGSGGNTTGKRQTVGAGLIPYSRGQVAIRVRGLNQNYYFCGITDNSGVVSIPWSTPENARRLDYWVPTDIIRPSRTACANTGTGVMSIVTGEIFPNTILSMPTLIDLHRGVIENPSDFIGNKTVEPLEIEASDASHAYLTAKETAMMWDTMGDSASSDLPRTSIRDLVSGLSIYVNVSQVTNGVTPRSNAVLLNVDKPTKSPSTVAHEMGHALMWNSLRLPFAHINPIPGNDYSCDGVDGWTAGSLECEKASFAEGFAELNRALWMWMPWAAPTDGVKMPSGYNIERRGQCYIRSSFKKARCNARALWDYVDSPQNDDEPMSRGFATVVTAFRRYPVGCNLDSSRDNRCSDEGWPWPVPHERDRNAVNWKDFKYHATTDPDAYTGLVAVESLNRMSRATDE